MQLFHAGSTAVGRKVTCQQLEKELER